MPGGGPAGNDDRRFIREVFFDKYPEYSVAHNSITFLPLYMLQYQRDR